MNTGKYYMSIGSIRLLNIKVIWNDTETIYEGMVEDAPAEIKALKYSSADMGNPFVLYVYEEFNPDYK